MRGIEEVVNPFENAFAQNEAARKSQILALTWGHLAPEKDKKYQGYIIFCIGIDGMLCLIDYNFIGLSE